MHLIDWLIVATYLVWVVTDGLKRSKATDGVEGYFLADRQLPWWAVGLSVMATQLSAITLVGTTGKGYEDGMRFVQFYFGLPIAMIILSVTAVPFFHRARVFTAYEYLEQRFDAKTRSLTSLLFLLSRGLSCGVIIAAPAVILSIVLQWNQVGMVLAIGIPTTIYTMLGGVQAVTWTDVKQMAVIIVGVVAAIVVLIAGLPADISIASALHLAGATGHMRTIDFSFSLEETYTFWSAMLGGTFLMLSYFGCDQSQVQRYLTAKSVDEGRHSLLMSAFVKIPLQALILLTGVLVYAYYLFTPPPMLFNPAHEAAVVRSERSAEYAALEGEFAAAIAERRAAATDGDRSRFVAADETVIGVRGRAGKLVSGVIGESYSDANYVFPTFVVTRMPVGLVGLLIAAVFAAAMSSIAAELNSLSTASVIDFYRRYYRREASDAHYLAVSKWITGFWGLFACGVAMFALKLGPLIEVVNRFGSFFYGSLLGVFVLAIGSKRFVTANGAFIGLLAGMGSVWMFAQLLPKISFLWHNVVGVVAVVTVGTLVSLLQRALTPEVSDAR